jgi:uridine kinase
MMHISGFPGSGKTTLGNKINNTYNVKDIDDFLFQLDYHHINPKEIKTIIENNMKEYISLSSRPVVFVGFAGLYPEIMGDNYPMINVKYKVWLDVDLEESCTRAIKRQFNHIYHNLENIIISHKNVSGQKIDEYFHNYCNYQTRKERWKNLKNIFQNHSYIPMDEFQIMELLNILQLEF